MAGSSTTELISELLLPSISSSNSIQGVKRIAIFVNNCIFREFVKVLNLDNEPMSWDYKLQIGTKMFEMKLIMLKKNETKRDTFLYDLVMASQYSMPWLERLTLFTDLESFYKLEEFIDRFRLRSQILQITDQEGPTLNDSTIRVVTFNDSVDKFDLIKNFGDIIQLRRVKYFFITRAFSWFQPHELKPVRIPWEEHIQLHSVLPIILHHLSSIKYTNELDIYDLISLKLAISDFPVATNHLSCEIDYFISRALRQMIRNQTYLNDNHFDLTQYLYDRNVAPSYLIQNYFLYEYQKYVATIDDKHSDTKWRISNSNRLLYRTIVLVEGTDIFRLLSSKSNVRFTIDGSKFGDMSFLFFTNLLAYSTVIEIILDTDYPWLNNEPSTNQFKRRSQTKITFVGNNTAHFVEDFVTSLKTLSHTNKLFDIIITQNLSDYKVFDNFICEKLEFKSLLISTNLLSDLTQCDMSQVKEIRFFNCTLENNMESWESYNSIEQIKIFQIKEDEWTWQYLFEFISKQLVNSYANDFKFDRSITILYDDTFIRVNMFTFRFDDCRTKLEILDDSREIIDLYDRKYWVMPDKGKCNYEFYQ